VTSSGLEPATFQLVAYCLKHHATAGRNILMDSEYVPEKAPKLISLRTKLLCYKWKTPSYWARVGVVCDKCERILPHFVSCHIRVLLFENTKKFVRRGPPKRIERMGGLLSSLVYCTLACNLPPMCSVVIYIALGIL
jgi:hypothetical protein